ncbi:MAG: SMP-30/gluconolactonase/LRE family protein [Verrucomicrobiales bacterium]|nr:SMP-30/gluconolactonase/LRE family protein [Verrucomicrobiales bacterium]
MKIPSLLLLLSLLPPLIGSGEDDLFKAKPFTETGQFTKGIEGPACDADGNLYAVSFGQKRTIGKVTPDGNAEEFVTLPEGSAGNGIRFDTAGLMYVADYPAHNVLKIDPKTKKIEVLAHESKMNQPNDLAIGPDGVLYASDPNWGDKTGQLWAVTPDGKAHLLDGEMGTTNGIEVSPDGKTLYVNESIQRKVWKFDLASSKGYAGKLSYSVKVSNKTLLKEFPDHGFDGMRCDVDGNLYITRHGKGTVVKLSPAGKILQEIDVLGKSPTNICFGGPDGRTAYVTDADQQRVVTFRVDRPGLSWKRWQDVKKAKNE